MEGIYSLSPLRGQQPRHPPVLSLGGMCFVRKWLEELVGRDQVGPQGPFDYTATTPELVQHILEDDFEEFLTPSHFIQMTGHYGEVNVQHGFYKDVALRALQRVAALDPGPWSLVPAGDFMPPMFKHPGSNGIDGLIRDLRWRAQRACDFLCSASWKVMVWGVAIPYSGYMEAKRH